MSAQVAVVRATHLQASSEALMLTSPSISAYLQTQKTSRSDETSTTRTKYQACSSCGSLLLPGYNCTVTSTKKRTRQDRLAARSAPKIISCSSCNTTDILPVTTKTVKTVVEKTVAKKAEAASNISAAIQASPAPNLPTSTAQSMPVTTATSTAKKRNRNKKSTLQAMLADRKPSNVQGFGLGLGDFMK